MSRLPPITVLTPLQCDMLAVMREIHATTTGDISLVAVGDKFSISRVVV